MKAAVEPTPFDPGCPRWLPDLAFPSYRFLPGQTPRHPSAGTAHVKEQGAMGRLDGDWRRNHLYLAGIDHFNFAYWWEAHEFWEVLWRRNDSMSDCRMYLQGLIQLAGALLKWHQGNGVGMAKLARKASGNLLGLRSPAGDATFMGAGIGDLRARVANLSAAAVRFDHSASILRRPGLTPVLYLGADRERGRCHQF